MKKYLFYAAAALAMASCTSDEFFGNSPTEKEKGDEEINFGTYMQKHTRGSESTGATAAEKLGNQFLVYGWKSDGYTYGTGSTAGSYDGSVDVFSNYLITYNPNSAYKTEDNTHDWGYVGNLSQPLSGEAVSQSIKYWDYSKTQYDFIAWDIVPGATASLTAMPNNIAIAGYKNQGLTFNAPSADELANVYIADQVTVTNDHHQAGDPAVDGTDGQKYGGYVTFKFRNAAAKVRVGLYETVPGYSISGVKFYTDGSTPASDDRSYLFASSAAIPNTNGTISVMYGEGTADVNGVTTVTNQAVTRVSATNVLSKDFNDLDYKTEAQYKEPGSAWMGRASNAATYGKGWFSDVDAPVESNYFTFVFPMSATELNLKCDYILTSIDGNGETIKVTGASAIVPAQYCEWKSNYAYTYLFKISDNTNGTTGTSGTDPAGLYPITFDAVVVDAIEGNVQETISELANATITTYEFGTVVTENDEYLAKTVDGTSTPAEIYVTASLMNGTNPATGLATLASAAAADTYKAELFLVNNLGNEATTEETVQNYLNNSILLTDITSELKFTHTMPAVQTADGVDKKFDGTNNKLAYFRPVAGQTYAVRMTDNSATPKVVYKVIKVAGTKATHTYDYTTAGSMNVNEGEKLSAAIAIAENYTGAAAVNNAPVLGAKNVLNAEGIKFSDNATAGTYDATAEIASYSGIKDIKLKSTDTGKDITINAFAFASDNYAVTPGSTVDVTLNNGVDSEHANGTAAYTSAADAQFELTGTTGSTGVTKGTASSGVVTLTAAASAKGTYNLAYNNTIAPVSPVAMTTIRVKDWSIVPDQKYFNVATGFIYKPTVTLKLDGADTDLLTSSDFTLTQTGTASTIASISGTGKYQITPEADNTNNITLSYANATPVTLTATNFSMAFFTTTACDVAADAFTAGGTYYVKFMNGANAEYVSTLSATNATITQTAVKGVYKIIVASDYDASNKKVKISLNYKGIADYITLEQ